jgi:glutathione S-transferase
VAHIYDFEPLMRSLPPTLEGEALIDAQAKLCETHIKPMLQQLDDIIIQNGGNDHGNEAFYAVRGKLSIADISVYAQMAWYQTGFYEGVPKNMHESFPSICKVMKTVKALPQVVTFESKPYAPLIEIEMD